MNNTGIYKISNNIDERIYIGSAVSFIIRFKNHKSDLINGKHKNILLQNFVNKYGITSINFEILELCEKEKLIQREQYYIDTLCPKFNICKVAGNTLGKPHRQETKNKIRNAQCYKVYQYSLDGNFIKAFDSSKSASEYLNCDSTGINKCCKGDFNSFVGYMWSYKKKRKLKPYIDTGLKKVHQYDTYFKLLSKFNSIKSASLILGIKENQISRICSAKKGCAKGFYFGYSDTDVKELKANNKKEIYVFNSNKKLIFHSSDIELICSKYNLKRLDVSRHLNSKKGILYKKLLFNYDKDFK